MGSKLDSSHIGRLKVNALRIIVYIVMGLTILLMFFIPKFIQNNTGYLTSALSYAQSAATVVYVVVCCLPFLYALFIVKRICDVISEGSSFSSATLRYLSTIVSCCYSEAVVNILSMIIFPILLNMQFFALNLLIIGICGAVAVFTTVLKELVKSAIRLREENELTI